MEFVQNKVVPLLLIFALAASPYCFGLQLGPVCLTPTTVSLALAAFLTIITRLCASLPLIPLFAFSQPTVIATLAYFGVGLWSGTYASDQFAFYKEIVQRTTIIFLPLFGISMGLRTINQAKNMLLAYLPVCGVVAVIASAAAVSSKFEDPVYIMGLHKNMTASLCATMAIIVVAHLITSRRPKVTIPLIKLKVKNRPLFAALLALSLLAIVAAQGRGGMLEVVAGTYAILFAMKAKPKTLIKFTIICIVGIAIIYKCLPEKAIEHVVDTKRHSANAVRLDMWTEMGRHFMKQPFSAVGWGNVYVSETGYAYYDLACVLLFDWMQMGIFGAVALMIMIACSAALGLWTGRRINPYTAEGFVILAATGLVAGKFTHGMVDTFWIARGANLHTWTAIGTCLFVRLWLEQNGNRAGARSARVPVKARAKPLPAVSRT
jgi:hypothetical protein